MINERHIVDLIERASDAQPFCPCGNYTMAIWRDGAVWLECASMTESHGSLIARTLAALSAPAHVRERIVDVPVARTELTLVA